MIHGFVSRAALLFLLAASCFASVLTPVVTPDGQTVTGPGWCAQIIPQPGQVYVVGGDDGQSSTCTPGNDGDGNEPLTQLTFGATSFVLEMIGNASSLQNSFGMPGQPGTVGPNQLSSATYTYTPSIPLPLEYYVQNGGTFTLPSGNIWAACIRGCGDNDQSPVPEPSTAVMLTLGLGMAGFAALRR